MINILLMADIGLETWVLPGILLVLIVVSLGFSMMKRNRYRRETDSLYENLKVGDKVKTYAGIFGEIKEIKEAEDGSLVIVLKTGDDKKPTLLTMDMAAIYSLDTKDEVIEEETDETTTYDEDKKTKTDEIKEEVVEEKVAPKKKSKKADKE